MVNIYNLSINGTTLDTVYTGIAASQPWLFPLLLMFEFLLIMISGAFAQSRRIGFSNIPMWGAVAGLVTTSSAFLLFVINGLVDVYTIGVCFGITIVFAAWFLLTDID